MVRVIPLEVPLRKIVTVFYSCRGNVYKDIVLRTLYLLKNWYLYKIDKHMYRRLYVPKYKKLCNVLLPFFLRSKLVNNKVDKKG